MAAYQLTSGSGVIREIDGASIPADPRNADWQKYQVWLAVAGNTPDPVPAPSQAQAAQTQYNAAIVSGLTVNWSTSTALNGTYALDQATQFNITAENVSILVNNAFTNGLSTKNWPDQAMTFHSFTIAQFKAFATAAGQYIDALISASQATAAGQSTTWPSASITIVA